MRTPLPPGRYPLLSWKDFDGLGLYPDVPLVIRTTGPVRPTNTRHGARLFVEVRVPGVGLREFPISFRSPSYVRLCHQLGEDCSRWGKTNIAVRVVNYPRKNRHVEVC